MIEWWNSLDFVMKIFWCITIAASLIFIIQTIMVFVGADTGADFDADFDLPSDTGDGDPGMGLLTFRNFVNFFLGFGWSAVLLRDSINSISILLLVSIVIGVLLVFLVMMVYKWLGSMQESGNIDVFKQAPECHGKVYLTVPAHRRGSGKVQITINDAIREYTAMTDGEELVTGTQIRVIEAINASTLLVEEEQSIII